MILNHALHGTAILLLASACVSSSPPKAAPEPSHAASPPPTPMPHGSDASVIPAQASTKPSTKPSTFEIRDDGVGPLRVGAEVSEASLGAQFPECEADWQRHKGKATPHVQLRCEGLHILDVVLAAQGESGSVGYVRVYREGIATPSGLGVGSSYQALADRIDGMVCRGIPDGMPEPGVIVRSHTLCTSPLFPHVAYVFRGVVFQSGERPDNAESLRIGEVQWIP